MKLSLKCLFLLLLLIGCLETHARKPKIINISGHQYARINDTLYAAICETSIADYKLFLLDLLLDSPSLDIRPYEYDSTLWVKKINWSKTEILQHNYFKHPAFDAFPIVNISFDAAVRYCNWLTEKSEGKRLLKREKLVFSLPTEKEWELLADNDGSGNPRGFGNIRRSDGRYNANINTFYSGNYDTIAIDGGYYTVQVDAYWPNRLGLLQVIGNVSEMTNIKDIEKGGSWWTKIEDCAIDKRENIQVPDPRVGFRVVVRIIGN